MELLVVIAVLAILALLLLPAMRWATEQAQCTTCLNNERSLANGCILFATDHDGLMPNPNWTPDTYGWLYNQRANETLGGPLNNSSAMTPAEAARYPTGQIWPYINNKTVYRCPMDRPTPSVWAQRLNQLSSYVMNGAVTGFQNRSYPLASYRGSAILFWEPPEGVASAFNDGADLPTELISQRHGGAGSNVVCFDGHAETMKLADFSVEATRTPGRLYCNPGSTTGR